MVISASSMQFFSITISTLCAKSLLCEHFHFLGVSEGSYLLLQCNSLYHYIYTLSKIIVIWASLFSQWFRTVFPASSMQFSVSLYLHFEQNHCHVSIPIFSMFTNGLFCFFNAISSITISTL